MKSVVYLQVRLELDHDEPLKDDDINNVVDELDYGFISTIDGVTISDNSILENTIFYKNKGDAEE